jgi:hypothetical protein
MYVRGLLGQFRRRFRRRVWKRVWLWFSVGNGVWIVPGIVMVERSAVVELKPESRQCLADEGNRVNGWPGRT